jgi:hypothetical protein
LLLWACEARGKRFELEYEVVAECAVQAEQVVVRAVKHAYERAQRAEHVRRASAVFFGKALLGLADARVDARVAQRDIVQRSASLERVMTDRQQQLSAAVQRIEPQRARQPARLDHEHRIDKPIIEALVTTRILEARREQQPAPRIQRSEQPRAFHFGMDRTHAARDLDAASCLIALSA